MNVKLDRDEFFELITVFIVEDAKARGKDFVGEDPADLTEYEQLIAHIAKFPMKTQLKMSRYRVEPKLKIQGRRLQEAMSKTDNVRLIV